MAGVGPTRKDPDIRARRNKDTVPTKTIPFVLGEQPKLPTLKGLRWPAVTIRWWKMWAESGQATLMTDTDWSFLLDTALIHARYWQGDLSLAGELRLRVAKFGATLEDRARLRIVFADAEQADGQDAQPRPSSKQRYGGLRLAE
ncbi:hypothetical protein [Alloactinosynnema sp. L-07]|uniref:phage terminase small subunit n=1 Tax=Alloactinosynnema sp. L-07 TaxID=1653480 RepID=UPI0006B662A3|nr:hypothetical protein [Alloactinosynnema sp. L-07]